MKIDRSNEDQHFRIQVSVQSLTPEANSFMTAQQERAAFIATQAARDAADKLGRDLVEHAEQRKAKQEREA
jgi:hypothetical protein